MSLLSNHQKTYTNDCHVLLDDNSVDDVSDSILFRIPLLIFISCLDNSIIKFILKSAIEIICSIPINKKQQEGGSFNCKWRPSLQSITEEEEEEEEEEEDLIFSQEPEKEKEEKEVSSQIMKATSQKENDMLTAAAAAVFSFSSASSPNNKALSTSSSSIAVPIHTILSNRFTLLMLHSRSLLRFNQAFFLLNCCSKFEISTFDIELN